MLPQLIFRVACSSNQVDLHAVGRSILISLRRIEPKKTYLLSVYAVITFFFCLTVGVTDSTTTALLTWSGEGEGSTVCQNSRVTCRKSWKLCFVAFFSDIPAFVYQHRRKCPSQTGKRWETCQGGFRGNPKAYRSSAERSIERAQGGWSWEGGGQRWCLSVSDIVFSIDGVYVRVMQQWRLCVCLGQLVGAISSNRAFVKWWWCVCKRMWSEWVVVTC